MTIGLITAVGLLPVAHRQAMARAVRDPASVGLRSVIADAYWTREPDLGGHCGCPVTAMLLGLGLVTLAELSCDTDDVLELVLTDAAIQTANAFDRLADQTGVTTAIQTLLDLLDQADQDSAEAGR